jgi:hypothetical protein
MAYKEMRIKELEGKTVEREQLKKSPESNREKIGDIEKDIKEIRDEINSINASEKPKRKSG